MINKKIIKISSFFYIYFSFILTNQSNAEIIWQFETNDKVISKEISKIKKILLKNKIKKSNQFLRKQQFTSHNFKITDISINKSYEQ